MAQSFATPEPDVITATSAGDAKYDVVDRRACEALNSILVQLKIMNMHLGKMTDNFIDEDDV